MVEWRQLIDNCAQGSRPAFDEFVKKYYALVKFLIAKKVRNENDHDDIIQEILLKFHRLNLFRKFQGNSELEFRAYLARICINSAYSHLSRTRADSDKLIHIAPADFESLDIALASTGPLPELMEQELTEEIHKAVSELPENYRDVINLRLLGNTHQEIADILGRPKGTIDSYATRALEILRGKLKKFASI